MPSKKQIKRWKQAAALDGKLPREYLGFMYGNDPYHGQPGAPENRELPPVGMLRDLLYVDNKGDLRWRPRPPRYERNPNLRAQFNHQYADRLTGKQRTTLFGRHYATDRLLVALSPQVFASVKRGNFDNWVDL